MGYVISRPYSSFGVGGMHYYWRPNAVPAGGPPSVPVTEAPVDGDSPTYFVRNETTPLLDEVLPSNATASSQWRTCSNKVEQLADERAGQLRFEDGTSPQFIYWQCPAKEECCEWECCSNEEGMEMPLWLILLLIALALILLVKAYEHISKTIWFREMQKRNTLRRPGDPAAVPMRAV